MKEVAKILERSYYMPLVRAHYERKLQEVLKDEKLREDVYNSRNFIMERINMQNRIMFAIILFKIIVAGYYGGIFWSVFTITPQNEDKEETFLNVFGLNELDDGSK